MARKKRYRERPEWKDMERMVYSLMNKGLTLTEARMKTAIEFNCSLSTVAYHTTHLKQNKKQ